MAEPRLLKLQSPAYGDPIFYKWPLVITKKHDEATEIVDTIRLVCEDFSELKYAVENTMLKDYDPKDYDSMSQLCQRYNKAIRNILSLWKGRAPPPKMFKPPSKDLLRHIINLCYSHAIKEPEKLNIYEPFSPEVYGETSFDMVARILDEVQNLNNETFIDLGSGVGQVVLQAAASNQFKECYGVEKAETPAMYAKLMEKEFRKWMDWYGKTYTEFTLEKGDFLEDKWVNTINECGVVFVNNFAFGPVVNHHLKSRFQTMKEGSRVISSREFCPMHFKFNKRNLSELGAMMRVTEIKPRSEEASVSWTGNNVSYYLHIVDRTRLEKYFSILKKRKEGQELDEDEMSLYSESNYSMDTNGTTLDVETLEDNLDDLYLGTTTRHQWQLLTDTIKQSKKEAKEQVDGTVDSKKGLKKKTFKNQTLLKKSGKLELKNKILRKYGKQAYKKAMRASQEAEEEGEEEEEEEERERESSQDSSTETDDSDFESQLKLKRKEAQPKKKSLEINDRKKLSKTNDIRRKPSLDMHKVEKDLDVFLGNMKQKYLEFIQRMNTQQYADRLKVMIECETAKRKLLQREISETERVVQNLISDGLTNFSSRLVELDVAVKTPLELLSQSTTLSERRQELENKVINMEIEVFNLEEKHRSLCAARDGKNRVHGMEPMFDSEEDELVLEQNASSSKGELTTKLCGAILTALNHRRSLIDKQSSLAEQISILEKISNTEQNSNASPIVDVVGDEENYKHSARVERPKPRPVAFVPPRMLSQDKKNSLSPEASVILSTRDPEFVSEQSTAFASTEQSINPAFLTINQSRDVARTSSEQSDTPTTSARRPRGRPRKRLKTVEEYQRSSSTQSDSSQGSKVEFDERQAVISETGRPPLNDMNNVANQQNNQTSRNGSHFDSYHVREERAPITFPLKQSNDSPSEFSKEFLKTTGKLLSAAAPKWRPVDELWVPLSHSKQKKRDLEASKTNVGNEPKPLTSCRHPELGNQNISEEENAINTILPTEKSYEQIGLRKIEPKLQTNEPQSHTSDPGDNVTVAASHGFVGSSSNISRTTLNESPTTSHCTYSTVLTSMSNYLENLTKPVQSDLRLHEPSKQPQRESVQPKCELLQPKCESKAYNPSPSKHNIYDNLQFGYLRMLSNDERSSGASQHRHSNNMERYESHHLSNPPRIDHISQINSGNIRFSHTDSKESPNLTHSLNRNENPSLPGAFPVGSTRISPGFAIRQTSTHENKVDRFSSPYSIASMTSPAKNKTSTKEKRQRKKKNTHENSNVFLLDMYKHPFHSTTESKALCVIPDPGKISSDVRHLSPVVNHGDSDGHLYRSYGGLNELLKAAGGLSNNSETSERVNVDSGACFASGYERLGATSKSKQHPKPSKKESERKKMVGKDSSPLSSVSKHSSAVTHHAASSPFQQQAVLKTSDHVTGGGGESMLHYPAYMVNSANQSSRHEGNKKANRIQTKCQEKQHEAVKSDITSIYYSDAVKLFKPNAQTIIIPSSQPSPITFTSIGMPKEQLPLFPTTASVYSAPRESKETNSHGMGRHLSEKPQVNNQGTSPAHFISTLVGRKHSAAPEQLRIVQTPPSHSMGLQDELHHPPPTKKRRARKPKKNATIPILPATTTTPNHCVIFSGNPNTVPPTVSYFKGQSVGGMISEPQVASTSSPIIFPKSTLSKTFNRTQVFNMSMATHTSGLNSIIIPTSTRVGLVPVRPAQSQPVSYVSHPRLILLPSTEEKKNTSHQEDVSNKHSGSRLFERRQSMSSPTFPPQNSTS